MRYALICVFLALVVQKDGRCAENEEDFKPTPIPLSEWPRSKQEAAETLQEIIKTEAPLTMAVPAHYWEDALRHSVYLTLVRDKIDQLIAKGDYIAPDSSPDNNVAKGFDDHGLWDKIKTARFDRLKEEPIPPSEVTILARGRLLEEGDGYRFAEDDATRNNCTDKNCIKGVKAYWSVKRMRQGEMSPGKYNYELTFSVTSHTPRKVKKPYESPVRTFTIKENSSTERPRARNPEPIYYNSNRSQRAIWIHKNLSPPRVLQLRPSVFRQTKDHSRGLDRIFSSLFSDEDSSEEPSYKYKQTTYVPMYPQHAKVGYVDDREPFHQKKVQHYPFKPQIYRQTHPPITPPPRSHMQHPYLNIDPVGNIPFVPQYLDNRYVPSNAVKTTRPAVLPTPFTNYPLLKESTNEVPVKTKPNEYSNTEFTTMEPDVVTTYKIYNHPKQSPMKVSYFPDHIRPPVYSAPPGVFVTMDKKPFKPMPPLKYVDRNKLHKKMPVDFRPSPQVLDTPFSEQDSSTNTAFRPITMNYTEFSDSKEVRVNEKEGNKNNRKPSAAKKPTKKHENIKVHRLTTVTPEIITAQSLPIEEDNSMDWANLLGAFTKTTPMALHKERGSTENSDLIRTTPVSTTIKEDNYEDLAVSQSTSTTATTTTTTTTPKPKKRTRPPPKFTKPEKIKKHKRVTSTTTTTVKPTRKYPVKKPSDDLTPQASSAATSGTNSVREIETHEEPVSTTSTTTPRPTTTKQTTSTSTTTSTPSTTVDTEQPVATTQLNSKNRFRQSTLMHKGTSVNHDKWSTGALDKNRTIVSHKFPLRRIASKFQGYIPTSTPRSPELERDREDHKDHAYKNSNQENFSSSTTEQTEDILVKTTQLIFGKQEISNDQPSERPLDNTTADDGKDEEEWNDTENDVQYSKDDNEYIFPTASSTHEVKSDYINLEKQSTTTEVTVVASPNSAAKNKTKCKKKKHNNLTTTEGAVKSAYEKDPTVSPISSSTTSSSTIAGSEARDIFDELFGGFTMNDATEEPKTTRAPEPKQSSSEKHEHYFHIDDDIEDFLHSFNEKNNHSNHHEEDKSNEEYEDEEDEDSPFNNGDENFDSRNINDEYYEESAENQDRTLSLLELMALE